MLTAGGVVALLAGALLIFNTFQITVAQRTRELALLRALGASTRQVSRSVRAEAAMIGLIGSFGGFLVGVALAALGSTALLGGSQAGGSLAVSPAVLVLSLAAGTAVAVLAASLPARCA